MLCQVQNWMFRKLRYMFGAMRAPPGFAQRPGSLFDLELQQAYASIPWMRVALGEPVLCPCLDDEHPRLDDDESIMAFSEAVLGRTIACFANQDAQSYSRGVLDLRTAYNQRRLQQIDAVLKAHCDKLAQLERQLSVARAEVKRLRTEQQDELWALDLHASLKKRREH